MNEEVVYTVCDVCDGNGYVPANLGHNTCQTCGGAGYFTPAQLKKKNESRPTDINTNKLGDVWPTKK